MTIALRELERYRWPPSTEAIALQYGLDPSDVIRFDGNVPALPLASTRPAAVARALATINEYDRGGYPELRAAIARRHGLDPDNIVLSAGSDELILLCARTYAPAGRIAQVPARTYSMYRVAADIAGATIVDDPATSDLTFVCRPNNPTGEMPDLPLRSSALLVVDEAYAEYAGESVVDLVDDGLIVLRTFSKAFGLAGARVGYAVASKTNAASLLARQAPLTIAAPSAALALEALGQKVNVSSQILERERLAEDLRGLGLRPLASRANFVFVPLDEPENLADALLALGIVVRRFPDGVRVSVRDRDDDDHLVSAIATVLDLPRPAATKPAAVRHLRATAETAIRVRLRPRGEGRVFVDTGSGLYDHLIQQLAFHAGMDLIEEGTGDLETGEHHTVEDAMRALGEALARALGDRRGLARYGEARTPMDEAMAIAVVDISGRPVTTLSITPDPGLAAHALDSFAQSARITLHVDAVGDNSHHVAEAAFKAVGRALRVALGALGTNVASTKGTL